MLFPHHRGDRGRGRGSGERPAAPSSLLLLGGDRSPPEVPGKVPGFICVRINWALVKKKKKESAFLRPLQEALVRV